MRYESAVTTIRWFARQILASMASREWPGSGFRTCFARENWICRSPIGSCSFSRTRHPILCIATVAAAQVAIGLGILVALVRNRDSVNVEDASLLKW